jgi:HSP20 family molecular chaperone IbpA
VLVSDDSVTIKGEKKEEQEDKGKIIIAWKGHTVPSIA